VVRARWTRRRQETVPTPRPGSRGGRPIHWRSKLANTTPFSHHVACWPLRRSSRRPLAPGQTHTCPRHHCRCYIHTDRLAPNFTFPHNLRQNQATDTDITSEREMCEWFNAQFDAPAKQINGFNVSRTATMSPHPRSEASRCRDRPYRSVQGLPGPKAQAFPWKTGYNSDTCDKHIPIYEGGRLPPGLATSVQHQRTTTLGNHKISSG
jgi:hypothetical protein